MERGTSPIRRIVFETIPTTTRYCCVWREVHIVTLNITAEFEGDVAHRIRCPAEHRRDTRKPLWLGKGSAGKSMSVASPETSMVASVTGYENCPCSGIHL